MPQTKRKPARTEHPLARALRSKIGKWCHFTHPETGEIIEGTYLRGRRVKRLVGLRQLAPSEGRGFMMDEQTFTVPPHIKITMGQPKR